MEYKCRSERGYISLIEVNGVRGFASAPTLFGTNHGGHPASTSDRESGGQFGVVNIKLESKLNASRQTFALNMLRAGVDIFSLQKLMGHADLQVLRRYLAQTTDDIAKAHRLGSPVDRGEL